MNGYSPGHSLFKDLVDGWIPGPYQNIYPALAAFEVSASVSRMHRDQRPILRDFYILHENAIIYPVDDSLIQRTAHLTSQDGFVQLRGADLVFACIAQIEDAYLVTLDKGFRAVSDYVKVIDLNASRSSPEYRKMFDM